MEQDNVQEIQERVDDIRSRGLYGALQVVVQEAERRIAALTKLNRLKVCYNNGSNVYNISNNITNNNNNNATFTTTSFVS